MRLVQSFTLACLILLVNGEKLVIAEVEAVVGKVLDRLDNYVHYHGDDSVGAGSISSEDDMAAVLPRQTIPYWYEEITHQGISAFGPSGYTVYRNVKDYGAVG